MTAAPELRTNLLLPDEPRWPADPGRPVIALQGVTKRFDDHEVLKGVDLDVTTGETTVICGQSGSGKSVLLKLMNGLMLPDEGRVLLFGEDTRQVSRLRLLQLRKRVTMMFQSYALMDSLTVSENIAFPLYENTSMRMADILPLVRELLEMLDLADAGAQLPAQLSGGMKKRVSLARAVISNPEVVLFDEPTTGLDPIMIEFVDQLIERTQERFGITSVIISHDTTSTLRLADTIAMLEDGRIGACGSPDAVLASDSPLARVFFGGAGSRLSAGADGAAPTEAAPGSAGLAARSEAAPGSAGLAGARGEGAGAAPGSAGLAATGGEGAAAPPLTPAGAGIVELIGLHKAFGAHKVLTGIDLSIPKGKVTVLIGASGSGKSVIMKHIIGIFRPDAGQVLISGEDITRLSNTELVRVRTRFGMLFQGAALLDAMTAYENVAFPLWERGVRKRLIRDRAMEILERLHIADLADRFPAGISNGQRKRVGLARAIVTRPEIMIYDEPTTGQDPVMTRYVDDMIVEAQELFDITSIVVSHDMAPSFRIGHQICLLYQGEIRVAGTPDEVKASRDAYVRRFIYAGSPEGERAAEEFEAERRAAEAVLA
jgi:ABC-type transporter Mla maintaining outer membrane lipid asymmetry ATPase subunit MlaF